MKLQWLWWLVVFAAPACAVEDPLVADRYEVLHTAHFEPDRGVVRAEIHVTQPQPLVRSFDFNAPPSRFSGFSGDGEVTREGDRLLWVPPESGGRLAYDVRIESVRGESYDARLTDRWAILRLGDVFPPAAVRSKAGAVSNASLNITGPEGWSFVTRYAGAQLPASAERRYVRPTGWMAAGELGVRIEEIAGRTVMVAGPQQQGVRRLDILTFLRFTLPRLVEHLPDLSDRVLIVSAADGMWRGALSGPGSLYVHADRPLVSENGTSTLLHELVHVGGRHDGDDWLVEGYAEYLALKVLRDSGGLSERRFAKALDDLAAWAKEESATLTSPSKGADTACAVLVLWQLDRRLPGGLSGWPGLQQRDLRGEALKRYAQAQGVNFPSCVSTPESSP